MPEDNVVTEEDVPPPEPPKLMEVEEATTKLRDELESFLAYRSKERRPDVVRHVLIRSPAGLGKTTSCVDLAVDYIVQATSRNFMEMKWGEFDTDWDPKWAFYVKTHALAKELSETVTKQYEGTESDPSFMIYRGRTHEVDNVNAPCSKHREANILGERGLSAASNLCRRKLGADTFIQCEDFEQCEYLEARSHKPRFAILMTAELPYAKGSSLNSVRHEIDPSESRFFIPVEDISTFVVDESPLDSLKIKPRKILQHVLEKIEHPELRAALIGALSEDALLDRLREIPDVYDVLKEEVENQRTREGHTGALNLDAIHVFSEFEEALGNRHNYRLNEVIENLTAELKSGRAGKSYSLRSSEDVVALFAQGRHQFPFDKMPGMFLDATGNETILKAFLPSIELVADINVKRNAYITQVTDNTFSQYSLLADRECILVQQKIKNFIRSVDSQVTSETNGEGRTLVVTNLNFRRKLTGEGDEVSGVSCVFPDTNVDVAHFGNIRGIDKFKDHAAIIIIGRNEPSPRGIERDAMAIWFDTNDKIDEIKVDEITKKIFYPRRKGWYLVDGLAPQPTNERGMSYHPDERVQALLENVRESETLQAIDRLRLVHNKQQKQAYILCNIPLPNLVVNRVLTWRELLDGGTKLERVFSKCDEVGIAAISLSNQYLSSKFSDLWGTPRAVSRWREGNPLEANKDYTYWGVFYRYRPVGVGGRASTAIVKNGVENPRDTLATELGCEIKYFEPYHPNTN
jgi:hypothetical protein